MKNKLFTCIAIVSIACANSSALFAAGVTSVPFVPTGLNPGDTYHIVFVTSGKRDGNSPDIAEYNAFVQGQAALSGALTENWGVEWNAIASAIIGLPAFENAPITAPVYLLDSTLIASGFADMWDGDIGAPINADQFGVQGDGSFRGVWTGTEGFGVPVSPQAPLGTIGGIFQLAVMGDAASADSDWVYASPEHQQVTHSLYALSEELTVVPEATSSLVCLALGTVSVARHRRRSKDASDRHRFGEASNSSVRS